MSRTIKINISDPVTDALVKSQSKRIAVLETIIKKKKTKKEDVMNELRELNSVKSLIKQSEGRIRATQDKTNSMVDAFKRAQSTQRFTIVPSPS